jgi:hypothetical protein
MANHQLRGIFYGRQPTIHMYYIFIVLHMYYIFIVLHMYYIFIVLHMYYIFIVYCLFTTSHSTRTPLLED